MLSPKALTACQFSAVVGPVAVAFLWIVTADELGVFSLGILVAAAGRLAIAVRAIAAEIIPTK